jgi:hypothetical protein
MLSKKSNAGGITIPDFKLYYKTITIKILCYLHINRYKHQWDRIENLGMNPHSYAHLIFDRVTKNIRWIKYNLFNNWCWERWLSACRKLKLHPSVPVTLY